MDAIIESFPDRPLTQEEVKHIADQDSIDHLEGVMGVRILDRGDRFHVQAGFHPEPGWHFEFYLDMIIETESSIGIAAYPKEEFPSYGEGMEQSILDVISVPNGKWRWISKGQKPGFNVEEGLETLAEYRDFSPEQTKAYETLIDAGGIQILER